MAQFTVQAFLNFRSFDFPNFRLNPVYNSKQMNKQTTNKQTNELMTQKSNLIQDQFQRRNGSSKTKRRATNRLSVKLAPKF